MTPTETPMTPQQALATAYEIVTAARVRGLVPRGHTPEQDRSARLPAYADFLTFTFERSWSVDCSLEVSLKHDRFKHLASGERYRLFGVEGPGTLIIYRVEVQVSWPGTGRSPSAATAAIALYREVVDLAAEIEARLAEQVVATWQPQCQAMPTDASYHHASQLVGALSPPSCTKTAGHSDGRCSWEPEPATPKRRQREARQ